MNLRIQPPSTKATSLKTLRLKWGLIAAGDFAQIEIDRLDSAEPHFQDDVELVVEKVQEFPGSRCEVSLRIVSDGVASDPADLIFSENEIELLDSQGRTYRRQGQTNTITGESALMKMSFLGNEGHTGPHRIRFRYPRIRSQRELEVVFRDVPLPLGRPE
jgi:hypothetical protein